MNTEAEFINRITDLLPKSLNHIHRFFDSDAEVLAYNGKKMLFSIDDFSQEDFFRDDDPYILGWNVAAGTISDVLASGGKTLFYAHSMSISKKNWEGQYIEQFAKGIADVLNHCGAGFIGGDFGISESWRYTGVALGETDKEITRKGAGPGDVIYMTGMVGGGNLEAALKLYSENKILKPLINKFRLRLSVRLKESACMKMFATSCIDSSDGVINAVNALSELNHTGYQLNNIPYLKEGLLACNLIGKPRILMLLGECGEYELVFTVRKDIEKEFQQIAQEQKLTFYRIGEVTENQQKKVRLKSSTADISDFSIRARDYENTGEYLDQLVYYAKNLR